MNFIKSLFKEKSGQTKLSASAPLVAKLQRLSLYISQVGRNKPVRAAARTGVSGKLLTHSPETPPRAMRLDGLIPAYIRARHFSVHIKMTPPSGTGVAPPSLPFSITTAIPSSVKCFGRGCKPRPAPSIESTSSPAGIHVRLSCLTPFGLMQIRSRQICAGIQATWTHTARPPWHWIPASRRV